MMDLVMNFDTDECLVTAMFDKGNRNDTMEAIDNIIPFLKFNTRIYNALKRHDVDTVGDLLDALRLPNWIQSFSNIGKQSQREIVQKMESLGLADDSYASVRKIKKSVRNVE